jgi:hypothetical protein
MRLNSPFVLNGRPIKVQCREIERRLRWPFRRHLTSEQLLFFKYLMTSSNAHDGVHLLARLKDEDLRVVGEHLDVLPQSLIGKDVLIVLRRLLDLDALNMSAARSILRVAAEKSDPEVFEKVLGIALRVTIPRSIRHNLEESFYYIANLPLSPDLSAIFEKSIKDHPKLLEEACINQSLLNKMYPRACLVLLYAMGDALDRKTLDKFAKIFRDEPLGAIFSTSNHQAMKRHRLCVDVGARPILEMSPKAFKSAFPDLSFY